MLYVYVYEGGDNYLSNSQVPNTNYQVPNTNFHVPITKYQLPITDYLSREMQIMVKEETKLKRTGRTPVIVQRKRPMKPEMMRMIKLMIMMMMMMIMTMMMIITMVL